MYAEIDHNAPAERRAAMKETARLGLTNELISELLIKDRADRLAITVTDAELKEAIGRLKQQYGITTDEQFEQSLNSSGLSRPEMEARLSDTLITNKVFGRELRSREQLSDSELRDRYNREKDSFRLPERARLREIVVLKPGSGSVDEARTARHGSGRSSPQAGYRLRHAGLDDVRRRHQRQGR